MNYAKKCLRVYLLQFSKIETKVQISHKIVGQGVLITYCKLPEPSMQFRNIFCISCFFHSTDMQSFMQKSSMGMKKSKLMLYESAIILMDNFQLTVENLLNAYSTKFLWDLKIGKDIWAELIV